MYIPLVLASIVLIFIIATVSSKSLAFWKKAAKHPNEAYELLRRDEAWLEAVDESQEVDMKTWTGPFRLFVPNIGKSVKFYGRIDKYEESQKAIEEKLKALPTESKK
jgi:hypothetical protein